MLIYKYFRNDITWNIPVVEGVDRPTASRQVIASQGQYDFSQRNSLFEIDYRSLLQEGPIA